MRLQKTSLAIDKDLLDAARKVLATDTIRDTVERALLEVLRASARRAEVVALSTMEGMDLDNAEIMAGAWRA